MEKPCQVACDLPLLNENSTAMAIGTSDQIRYSQVKPSRNHGWPQGLRRRIRRRGRAVVAARFGGSGGCPPGGLSLRGRGHDATWEERLVAMT